jgi:hypothetical protein
MWQVSQETELRFPSPVRVDELCGCSLFPHGLNQPEKLLLSEQRTTIPRVVEKVVGLSI